LSLLALAVVLAILVYAIAPGKPLTQGQTPNPGHPPSELGIPNPCSSGQFLKYNGKGWVCGNIWTKSGINVYYNSGNVGIGTTNPTAKLDVNGNIKTSGEIIGTLGTGAAQFRAVYGSYGIMLRNDGGNTYFLLTASGDPYGGWNGLRPFIINDASGNVNIANTVFAHYNGNVGIGTTNPTSKLDVNGNIKVDSGSGIILNGVLKKNWSSGGNWQSGMWCGNGVNQWCGGSGGGGSSANTVLCEGHNPKDSCPAGFSRIKHSGDARKDREDSCFYTCIKD